MFQIEKSFVYLVRTAYRNAKCTRAYSRKNDPQNSDSYKVVSSNDVVEDSFDSRFNASPNWELFGTRGHRFLLPGSVGPAWHETGSMVPVDGFNKPPQVDFETLECISQDCPVLLKDAIRELFPGVEASGSNQLTIVTLTRKKLGSSKKDNDSEYHAKTFMWAAQEICLRLKDAGYWADFINPFSGRPYLSPFHKATLYESDERFRCIGFQIQTNGTCKVIQVQNGKNFIGSLFTNAPPSTDFLLDLLSD